MDSEQAKRSVSELFSQPFDRNRYQLFVNNLLNQFERRDVHYTRNYIPDAYRQHINQYWRVGKYIDPDGNELDLLIVQVKSAEKLERARSALRNFAVNRLKQFEKQASLIAFYAEDDGGDDWRFSFVKIEHEAYQDDMGKVKLKQELTPARRYSYLVGVHENSHTASKQFMPLLEMDYADPRIDDIERAFGIEKVTEEFFDQYKALFQKLAEHLRAQTRFNKGTEQERDQRVSRFSKKLLGQIVFLYFLQKKGWLGVKKSGQWGDGPRRFMRQRHDEMVGMGLNYYHDFLQYLFYEALADQRASQEDPGYYSRFDCRVPFLNGGLFEADYDWRKEGVDLPNDLFKNSEKNKNGDVGTGILDVFDRYNFTIKEDEPLEKEVAVDPEMLGKVFENMLEVTERKSKGAFYTPREIVHYMCQESLVRYLDNRLNTYACEPNLAESQADIFGSSLGQQDLVKEEVIVPRVDIETLIRKGRLALENDTRVLSKGKETDTYKFQLPASVRQYAVVIDTALENIKVCDPAIGSGAFPVGLLHEIVNARQALAPHSGRTQTAYELKRHAIGESIYGVDIDASAIDIARLRLWLSLIVDETDYGSIEALPNLDYKIVRGNSLIGFPEDWKSPAFKSIETLKKKFFTETDQKKKSKLKLEIDEKIEERLHDSKKTFGSQIDFDFRLFFSEVWHHKGGFDVIVGNPPYGSKLSEEHKTILKSRFATIVDRIRNSFLYFIGISESLISEKGVVVLIVPNEFLYQIYMGKARKHYLSLRRLFLAINVGEKAFKAIVPTCVIGFDMNSRREYDVSGYDFRSYSLREIENQLGVVEPVQISNSFLLDRPNHTFSFDVVANQTIRKMASSGQNLEEYCLDIANGISTSCDDVYIVEKQLAVELRLEKKYLKPTLKGKDFNRYYCPDVTGKYVLYVDKDFQKEEAPNILKYLEENKERLIEKSVEKRKGSREWHLLFRGRYKELFSSPKILVRQTGDQIVAALDQSTGYYCIDSVNVVQLNVNTRDETRARFLVGLLNSEVLNFYYREISQESGRVMAQVKPSRLRVLPVQFGEAESHIATLVHILEVLALRDLALQRAFFEELLNGLVYELYFSEEIGAANKEIRRFLGDPAPISLDMEAEEKLAIIEREFDTLYDPRHPIRKQLDTLDSVQVVRTIRNSLQTK